ncbi:MAG TPA: hypothetical protein VGI60_18680 [Chthoniobacterales bacterium]|jgi:hypothetical protein
MSFAATAFQNVFIYRDDDYLRSNLSENEHAMTIHEFILSLDHQLGEPVKVRRPQAPFTTGIVARRLWIDGKILIPFYDSRGLVWVNVEVSRIGEGWQINHIG